MALHRLLLVLTLSLISVCPAHAAIVLQQVPGQSTLSEVVHTLDEKLEPTPGDLPPGIWEKLKLWGDERFNLRHRRRVRLREQNRLEGTQIAELQVPTSVVIFNTATALGTAHVSESLLFGPALIWAGQQSGMPSTLAWLLTTAGALMAIPIPIPFFEWATEPLCLTTLFVSSRKGFQRSVYRVELAVGRTGLKVGHLLGINQMVEKFFEWQSGMQRLATWKEPAEHYVLVADTGEPLAELWLVSTDSGDAALRGFRLHRASATTPGKRELHLALRVFGPDIRDAVEKPHRLIQGGHGELTSEGFYRTVGNSVQLKGHHTASAQGKRFCQGLLLALSAPNH